MHRRAFRALLPGDPAPAECIALLHRRRPDFEAAARAKIARDGLPTGARFHLTSRDIAQAIAQSRT